MAGTLPIFRGLEENIPRNVLRDGDVIYMYININEPQRKLNCSRRGRTVAALPFGHFAISPPPHLLLVVSGFYEVYENNPNSNGITNLQPKPRARSQGAG